MTEATGVLTMTDFILQRVAEDEAAAHYAQTRDAVDDRSPGGWGDWWIGHYHHYHRHNPARVLADCEAKRRIVDGLGAVLAQSRNHEQRQNAETTLGHLATVYADHPDYRGEWAP